MLGTADRVDVWLLLGYRGTWHAKAMADNDLPVAVQTWLRRQVDAFANKGLKARPQFVRQSASAGEAVPAATLFVAAQGELHRLDADDERAFAALDLARGEALPPGFQRVEAPQYFVCANGQRDVCCSRFGLPLYAKLRQRLGRRAWQITHVGGHRFAPNVLVLPQGVLYGRVTLATAPDFLAAVEAGRLSRPHLRGRSAFPPPAQAAEAALGDPALEVVSCGAEEVVLRTASGCHRISVRASPPLEVLASCGDDARKVVRAFVAGAIVPSG